jgi:hypothetical protein
MIGLLALNINNKKKYNMKVKNITKNKSTSKLSFANKLKNARRNLIKKLDVSSEELITSLHYEQEFKREIFEHKVVALSNDDLPLIDHMRSEKINNNNREKNSDNVKRLLRCLKAGEWHFESIDIMVCSDGYLMNGQHTLEAISQYFNDATTPKDAEILLGFKLGVNQKAMPYLDTQKKRSPEQNLKIKDVAVNRTQKEIILAEGRKVILGQPFGKRGQINYFEYENVIKKNQGILNRVFDNISLSMDFPHKAIGYALFSLAKKDEELAKEIMDDICAEHSESLKDKAVISRYNTKYCKEHDLVELFREERHRKMAGLSSKTDKDCYRSEEFYPLVVDWLVEKHNVDRKVFSI